MKAVIEIETIEGWRTVQASVQFERFAIHKTLYGDRNKENYHKLTLTHIPTGLSIRQEVTSAAALLDLARDLQQFTDTELTDAAYKRNSVAFKRVNPVLVAWRKKWGSS